MADITMCDGYGCPVKDKCYRHTAPKNDLWQSMFVAPPIDEMDQCKYFWDNKENKDGS